jgi:protein ImuA
MTRPDRERALADLRERVERLEGAGRHRAGALPFGVQGLDAHLPDGGLPLGSLHDVVPAGPAAEHAGAATLFAAGILARLEGPVLWVLIARDLFAPSLARVGLHPDRVLYAEVYRESGVLPLVEEGLRHPGLAGVVGEVAAIGLTSSRRLQLAAEASGVLAIVLRRQIRRQVDGTKAAPEPSAGRTRWRVAALPSGPPECMRVSPRRARWLVELERCRGAGPGQWTLEACDAEGRLASPIDLAHRPREEDGAGCLAAR